MRVCRFESAGTVQCGLYDESRIMPLTAAAANSVGLPPLTGVESVLDVLPGGRLHSAAKQLHALLHRPGHQLPPALTVNTADVQLLVPVPRPNKLFLLAGNYAAHIQEGGGVAAERAETFPYVFMKPPSTTLTDAGRPIVIPRSSPKHVDWELELAVIIGRGGRHIAEADALTHVAGYTVINDISDRKFRPNPGRKQRDKDSFFDWLHGKWHDSFCPCGPCVTSAEAIADPQALAMTLKVNGTVRQNASTGQQIFPVAAVIAFLSEICTLEPGDIISTGTPAGVGNSTGTYLQPGDAVEAWIDRIGTLTSPVTAEA